MKSHELLPISAFARLTGISRPTLIYYDEIGLFKPTKRGDNGYRYYSPQQIITVNLINVLTDLQIPLNTIAKLVQERTPESVLALLSEQEKFLEQKIRWLRDSRRIIKTLSQLITRSMQVDEQAVVLKNVPQHRLILGPENDWSDTPDFYEPFLKFCDYARKRGYNLCYPTGGMFESFGSWEMAPNRPNRFFFYNPNGRQKTETGEYLLAYTRGFYGETNDLPQRIARYAAQQKLRFEGPVYNTYLQDEISISDPGSYLLEVTARVAGS
jgi:DNA-binding transcriptional MerR regulator